MTFKITNKTEILLTQKEEEINFLKNRLRSNDCIIIKCLNDRCANNDGYGECKRRMINISDSGQCYNYNPRSSTVL